MRFSFAAGKDELSAGMKSIRLGVNIVDHHAIKEGRSEGMTWPAAKLVAFSSIAPLKNYHGDKRLLHLFGSIRSAWPRKCGEACGKNWTFIVNPANTSGSQVTSSLAERHWRYTPSSFTCQPQKALKQHKSKASVVNYTSQAACETS